jgi:hypothetical protein
MEGLEVKYGDAIFEVALDGAFGVDIEHRCSGVVSFDILGVDKTHVHKWIETAHLHVGDEIVVKIKDNTPVASNVKQKYIFNEMSTAPNKDDSQNMWHEKLMKYHALKNKLKKDGLID